ncbi:SAP30-binding protein [Lingula anatina]|uniref:SAP30-binding protein n=1 Tax=Lingula anatina TaxID=7574 RepID=A0A1S3JKG6_LINAN|nr:SAP30-binding protein [Lingula anatina]|eukprot:XP_013410616.1 SAP30-binding protein [Lingula anatina]
MERNDSQTTIKSLASAYADADSDPEKEPEIDTRISDSDSEHGDDQPLTIKTTSDSGEGGEGPPVKKPKKVNRLVSYAADEIEESSDEEEKKEDDDMAMLSEMQGVVDYGASMDSLAASSLSRSVQHLSEDEIQIPPEPPGRCSRELQDRIAGLFDLMNRTGVDMNDKIQREKDFRNPSIYAKLVEFCEIDEKGTNYPPDIFDPHFWGKESYYDELAKVQKVEMDKKEREKKEKTKVEFVVGTAKKSTEPDDKKRKSKWDAQPQVLSTARPTVITTTVLNPPVVSVTTSSTGAKTTVISAVGSITASKKSK